MMATSGVRCCFLLNSDFWLKVDIKHDLSRVKSEIKLSQKQHLIPV